MQGVFAIAIAIAITAIRILRLREAPLRSLSILSRAAATTVIGQELAELGVLLVPDQPVPCLAEEAHQPALVGFAD